MGVPLMLQEADNQKIEDLKKDLHLKKKIDVIRAALLLLEKESERLKRIERWKRAAALVAENSQAVNEVFQPHAWIKQNDST